MRGNHEGQDGRRHLHLDAIDLVLRKYARSIGLDRGYSAHSMRAMFITTVLDMERVSVVENGIYAHLRL